jgi:signal transduction histidine kinase/CheY-like chemotaxis protein
MKRIHGWWADLPLRGKGFVVVAIPLVALLGAMGSLGRAQADEERAEDAARRVFIVRNQIRTVEIHLLEAETGIHGYVLARDPGFLEPYSRAFEKLPEALRSLVELVGEDPSQLSRANQLAGLAAQKLEIMANLRSAYTRPGVPPERRRRLLRESNAIMTELRATIGQMRAEEQARLDSRLDAVQAAQRREIWATGAAVAFGLLGGVLVAWLFTTGIVKRIERLKHNAGLLAEEKPLVALPRGEDEIGDLGHALETAGDLLVEREHGLRQAKEDAEQANRAKSEFLSRTSHELRTPLNAILGFAQLMKMNELDPQESESVDQIMRAGRHLLELINDVLDIARIEAGGLAIAPDAVRVDHAVREAVELVGPMVADQGVRLETDVGSVQDRFLVADPQRLKQILLNLLSNAIKYNQPGGKVVLSAPPSREGEIRLSVADTGPGMSPEQLERLFTPFDRLGAERTGVEGTGLGLALSKLLAEIMGGDIGVHSEPGAGTTFWLDMPVVDPTIDEIALPRVETDDPVATSGSDHTVLYIEDNLSNLRLVERVLVYRPGTKLLPATLGSLGFELARKFLPDLVLLDLHLPDVPGEEILRRLRADPSTQDLTVVVISADATSAQMKRASEAGANGYITKPLDVRHFLDVLDRNLGARSRAQ